ncbi:hypothetical protein [Streptomyces sp. NPDC051129]|uniref:VOC family protein n=1 Tax=Streptomyces sp. NPDC051129 TaxID=3154639 RepID=UPI0034175E82
MFRLPVTYEDDNSAVFSFGNTIMNLLQSTAAHELIGPMNRPWGIRTASFKDPGGRIWEVAQ